MNQIPPQIQFPRIPANAAQFTLSGTRIPCGVAEDGEWAFVAPRDTTSPDWPGGIDFGGREDEEGKLNGVVGACMPVHIAIKRHCGGNLFNRAPAVPPHQLISPSANHQHHHTTSPISPFLLLTYDKMPIEIPSFYERGASITFDLPTTERGYLPQINEKLGQWISWDVVRVGGDAHLPIFVCTPSKHPLSHPHRVHQ